MTRTLRICIQLLSVVAFLCVPVFQAWASPADVGASMPALAETASWPMLAANPQRTSWTPEEVRGNLSVDWYRPIEPYIPYKVQPIGANGAIYVSSARGLYAFRASDGSLLWVYATEMPLGHSPTIATVNGKSIAYVGGYDHKIHAVDATTGQALSGYSAYQAGAGFETNPLVIQDSYTNNAATIFAGNRDGYFYALDAVTGAMKWRFQTQAPILFSAAYKNGILYFASNDMHAYALNASSGTLLWKSAKLLGQGFHSFWPVIYTNKSTGKDYVSFTSGENSRNTEQVDPPAQVETYVLDTYNLPSGALPATNPPVAGDWASGSVTLNGSSLTNYFANYPWRRVVFILDASSGQEFTYTDSASGKATYAPFGWSGIASSGTKYPGIVNGLDGVYYQQTAYTDYNGWVSRGAPVGWKFGTPYLSKVADQTFASDEPTSFSSGGRVIYYGLCCDRVAAAADVTIPYGQSNRSWQYWGYNLANNSLVPGYQQMYNDGDPGLYNEMNGWQIYSGKNQSKNGVYGKHSATQSPPIPYNGKVYVLRGNALIAFSATGTNPKTPLPLATIVSAQGTHTPPSPAELQQRLETEVQKMISAGHLRPGYSPSGFIDLYGNGHYTDDHEYGEIFDYFQSPADTVYTLLLAYPYLSSSTQASVKSYLQANYGPGAPYDFTKIVHIGWRNGADRTWSDIPADAWDPEMGIGSPYRSPLDPTTRPTCAGGDGSVCGYWKYFPPFSFYAAWKYAQIVGNNDASMARSIFNAMSGKLEAPLSSTFLTGKPYFINLYAAGYYGYLQLKQLAGLGGDTTVQSYYNQMLSLRVNSFSKDIPWTGMNYNRALSVARNFMFLTPEIADYMSQNIKAPAAAAVSEYDYVAPYWFVTRFDGSVGEGTFQPLYDSSALFQAKAWILKETYGEVVEYLDVPAFAVGDLLYIQNLVAALQAPSDGRVPIFADVPFTHPYNAEIEALYQAGYTAGCGVNPLRYCPEATMNRAESSVFVERGIHTASYDPPAPASQVFSDMPLDSWAAKWVNGLWQDQYTAGCGTNPLVYCPWQGHTRAEGCVFYLRMMNGATYEPPQPAQQTFADVPLNTWYAKWVQAAYDAGLLTACDSSPALRFCPEEPLTRALAAYMMVQAKGLRGP